MLSLSTAALAFSGAGAGLNMRVRSSPMMQEAEVAAPPPPPPPPKISVMRVGDKTLAGDWNFDPLQLADNPGKLAWYREAEVKHCRLAMLAAAGWPMAELLNRPISNALGAPALLTSDGRVPSVLNGGLGGVPPVYWAAVLGLAVWVEGQTIDFQLNTGKRPDNYLPGMIMFDPLKMDSEKTRNAEIQNGRLAMIAITAFALEEAITRASVVADTPFFFMPVWSSMM